MSSILERLREALAPDYIVEREIASGGMGIVFLAREVALDRRVAVKIIRPELATAQAAHRFLREARILAHLSHPNVLPVHRAGEADGLFYYVMEYVEGETLADRLKHGPLPVEEARKLGRDLLDGLEAVHRHGVVHRDIKPRNILLIGGRAVLCDFGIARVHEGTTPSREKRGPVGTPGYMPPEQALGGEVTPRSDLYVAAMVLYEALTGRRWDVLVADAEADFAGVPRSVRPILRRALEWEPERRWPDARAFRRALWRTRTRKYRRQTAVLTALGLLVGAIIAMTVLWPPPRQDADLAILPFEVESGIDSEIADRLTVFTRLNLEFFLTVASPYLVREWWGKGESSGPPLGSAALDALGVRNLASGSVSTSGRNMLIEVWVMDRSEERVHAATVPLGGEHDLVETGNMLGLYIARVIAPDRVSRYEGSVAFKDRNSPAVIAFLDGERAFERNHWATAAKQYQTALMLDSTFALAEWRLSNAWRWLMTGEPQHPDVDLTRLYEQQRDALFELDRLLIEAQLARDQVSRLEIYERAIEKYPRHAYPAFLYAEELFNRGPLVGRPLEEAADRLADAVAKDSAFAPALLSLLWASIRLGRRDEAQRWLDRYKQVVGPPMEGEMPRPLLFQLAFRERFVPEKAAALPDEILQNPAAAAELARTLRFAPTFGIAKSQVEIGRQLAADSRLDSGERASAHEAQALGLIALGQVSDALMHFDSAAALFDKPEASIEAAEWRVVASALGLPGIPVPEIQAGRLALEQMTDDPVVGVRAAWALALHQMIRGDEATAGLWRNVLLRAEPDTAAERLGALLEAMAEGRRGRYEVALDLSAVLLAYDSAGRGGDPFARAVLHLKRGEWLDSLERREAADSARLWYEHFEITIHPVDEALAAEIDWALGTYAEWLRTETAFKRGDIAFACEHLERVRALWSDADSAYAAFQRQGAEYARKSCQH